jgi:hypothetical protein
MGMTPGFDDLLQKKYQILQQQADSGTTTANAKAQEVGQQQALQQQNNDAAMDRARLAANAQTQAANMNNDAMMDRASLAAQTQTGIAGQEQSGAMARALLGANTQTTIAGMENQLGRDRLNQQGQQFGQTLRLDTAKAYDKSLIDWATAALPTMGPPTLTPDGKGGFTQQPYVKSPGVTITTPSPLAPLAGANPSSSGLGGMSDEALDAMKKRLSGQGPIS